MTRTDHRLFAGQDTLYVAPWLGALGVHDVRDVYVEMFWLPVVGPSCLFLARRFAHLLDASPGGVELDVPLLAESIGLSSGVGPNAPVVRTLGRLVRFGLARLDGPLLLARRHVTDLPDHHARRLAPSIRQELARRSPVEAVAS